MPSPDTHNQAIDGPIPPLLKSLSLTRVGARHRAGPAAVVAAQRRRRRVAARCGRRFRLAQQCRQTLVRVRRDRRRQTARRTPGARRGRRASFRLLLVVVERLEANDAALAKFVGPRWHRQADEHATRAARRRFRDSDGAGSSRPEGQPQRLPTPAPRAPESAPMPPEPPPALRAADACHAAAAERAAAPGPRYFLCFETPVSLT